MTRRRVKMIFVHPHLLSRLHPLDTGKSEGTLQQNLTRQSEERREKERSERKERALAGIPNGTMRQTEAEIAWAESEIQLLREELRLNPRTATSADNSPRWSSRRETTKKTLKTAVTTSLPDHGR